MAKIEQAEKSGFENADSPTFFGKVEKQVRRTL